MNASLLIINAAHLIYKLKTQLFYCSERQQYCIGVLMYSFQSCLCSGLIICISAIFHNCAEVSLNPTLLFSYLYSPSSSWLACLPAFSLPLQKLLLSVFCLITLFVQSSLIFYTTPIFLTPFSQQNNLVLNQKSCNV